MRVSKNSSKIMKSQSTVSSQEIIREKVNLDNVNEYAFDNLKK